MEVGGAWGFGGEGGQGRDSGGWRRGNSGKGSVAAEGEERDSPGNSRKIVNQDRPTGCVDIYSRCE